jgi:hypothetical protein
MVFVMRGVPAMAITSSDFETASRVYSHSAVDTPDILDFHLLADAACFLARVIQEL